MDYPIQEVLQQVNETRATGGPSFHFHQKWTCSHCGVRQTMVEEDKMFAHGKCEECGKVSKIEKCNYLAIFLAGSETPR